MEIIFPNVITFSNVFSHNSLPFGYVSRFTIYFINALLISDADGHQHEEPPMFRDSQLAQLIDPVLENDDFDNDGMIDYAEFIMAQLKTKAGEREAIEVSV